MSTRAAIGMKMPDGKVATVYLHSDGNIADAGIILGGWYNTPEKVGALITLGNLSCLGTRITPEPGTTHSFAHPQPDVTVAYHRDRGEAFKPNVVYRDADEYRRNGRWDNGAAYLYLYADGKWFVYSVADEDWIKLKVTVNREEK